MAAVSLPPGSSACSSWQPMHAGLGSRGGKRHFQHSQCPLAGVTVPHERSKGGKGAAPCPGRRQAAAREADLRRRRGGTRLLPPRLAAGQPGLSRGGAKGACRAASAARRGWPKPPPPPPPQSRPSENSPAASLKSLAPTSLPALTSLAPASPSSPPSKASGAGRRRTRWPVALRPACSRSSRERPKPLEEATPGLAQRSRPAAARPPRPRSSSAAGGPSTSAREATQSRGGGDGGTPGASSGSPAGALAACRRPSADHRGAGSGSPGQLPSPCVTSGSWSVRS
mmetsp:Transcript_71094/g.224560  ORF Transcript_71094/g.224560 Transcript_71094/m.224560 type:complete len:284 (-) Transcript_71094:763-1614(-)